jgi:hypothetical protein
MASEAALVGLVVRLDQGLEQLNSAGVMADQMDLLLLHGVVEVVVEPLVQVVSAELAVAKLTRLMRALAEVVQEEDHLQ